MARTKTTQAVVYSARINPISSNPHEVRFVEIVEHWAREGYNFKQLIVDRVLRCEGDTPEMFDSSSIKLDIAGAIEPILAHFAEEILSAIRNGSVKISDTYDEDGESTEFGKTFAKGFLQRRQNSIEDDDE